MPSKYWIRLTVIYGSKETILLELLDEFGALTPAPVTITATVRWSIGGMTVTTEVFTFAVGTSSKSKTYDKTSSTKTLYDHPTPFSYNGAPIAYYDGSPFEVQPVLPPDEPLFKFSKNFIPVKLSTLNHLEQSGERAVNVLDFFGAIPNLEDIALSYNGGKTVVEMLAVNSPDDSGLQFPSGNGSAAYVESLVPYFAGNYYLNRDFDITANGTQLIFTAKKQGYGYDMADLAGGGIWNLENTVEGLPELIKEGFGWEFKLFCQTADGLNFEEIYAARLPVVNGIGEADLAAHLHDYLERDVLDIPGDAGTPLNCTKSCRQYYYTYAESWGNPVEVRKVKTSYVFTVLSGGLSFKGAANYLVPELIMPDENDASKDKFLRQGQTSIQTRSNQPQFLYFFNGRENREAAKLRAKLFFNDNTDATVTLETLDMELHKKYGFNLRFDAIVDPADYPDKTVISYQVWMETSVGSKISEYISYVLDYSVRQWVRYFLSWSSWGALESRACFGKGNTQYELNYSEAFRIHQSGYRVEDGKGKVFDLKLNNEFKVSTGYMQYEDLVLNRDFFLSAYKFRFYKEQLLPIKVTSKNINEVEDDNNLYAQIFEYAYLWDENAYTEGDADDAGLQAGLNSPTITTVFGTVLIVDQDGNLIEQVAAPGQYQVKAFTAIKADRSMNNGISIIAP